MPLHRAQVPVSRLLLAATGCPVTTRQAPRRTPTDGVAHRLRHLRSTGRNPQVGDAVRPARRRADRSLLDARGARPARSPSGRSPSNARGACSLTTRDRSRVSLALPAPSHPAAGTTRCSLGCFLRLGWPKPTLRRGSPLDRPSREPKLTLDSAETVPVKPPAQVAPGRSQPARRLRVAEAPRTRLCQPPPNRPLAQSPRGGGSPAVLYTRVHAWRSPRRPSSDVALERALRRPHPRPSSR